MRQQYIDAIRLTTCDTTGQLFREIRTGGRDRPTLLIACRQACAGALVLGHIDPYSHFELEMADPPICFRGIVQAGPGVSARLSTAGPRVGRLTGPAAR